MHFQQSSMPRASESSMPLALQMFTAQISGPLLVSYLSLQGPDIWDRDCKVLHIFRAGFPQQEPVLHFFVTSLPPTYPIVSWAELPNALLCACEGRAHCCIAFLVLVIVERIVWVCLSAALPKSYGHCCSFVEINQFLYDFAVGHRVANLLLADDDYVSATSHRPHIGCQFSVVMGFKLSPLAGVASHVLGLWQWTETKAIDVDKWMFIVLDQGMAQKTLRYNSMWMVGKEGRKLYINEHIMKQWWMTLEQRDIKLN